MNKVITVNKRKRLDVDSYVNTKDGTTLLDNLKGNSKLTITEDTDFIIISSDNYVITDVDAILSLYEILGRSDISYITLLGVTTKNESNILFNNNIPHTNKTLQQYLKFNSQSKFLDLIKRLIKANVLYQIKCHIGTELRVGYILNPNISRRRKTFNKDILSVFDPNNTNKKEIIYRPAKLDNTITFKN
jgi:hypothetical protein